ncbi:hypothetical protein PVL29_026201 [Vitis rotundifolia]|uniref:NB-ARC domain-containing protein n=1 Tax=Vitis rotundifolia TaxID=103349 RepID=A0AA38YLU9_VITRO|nr:hypothetical protein PVL29_026201 [Vitis rotundifolia]
MGCKEMIKMEPLFEEERYNALIQKEEEIAKDIIKECGSLPLAIVTTARSMSVVYSIARWRNALNELREHVKGHTIDMENDVFKILEFSYNRLNDEKLQECLLYCALFPEDFEIRRGHGYQHNDKEFSIHGENHKKSGRSSKRDRVVGSLAKLKKLRELNLSDNRMETIPDVSKTWRSKTSRYRSEGAEWVEKVRDP